jgi:transcriptional regulator with XRE-family HTH domain
LSRIFYIKEAKMKDFGERLKQRRIEYGLTQEELARRVTCNRTMILYIECGDKTPSLALTRRLAKALNLTLDELVEGTGA